MAKTIHWGRKPNAFCWMDTAGELSRSLQKAPKPVHTPVDRDTPWRTKSEKLLAEGTVQLPRLGRPARKQPPQPQVTPEVPATAFKTNWVGGVPTFDTSEQA